MVSKRQRLDQIKNHPPHSYEFKKVSWTWPILCYLALECACECLFVYGLRLCAPCVCVKNRICCMPIVCIARGRTKSRELCLAGDTFFSFFLSSWSEYVCMHVSMWGVSIISKWCVRISIIDRYQWLESTENLHHGFPRLRWFAKFQANHHAGRRFLQRWPLRIQFQGKNTRALCAR